MPDLAYWEWSCPEDADRNDWASVVAANPATEVGRITEEFTDVERGAMDDDEFDRERLGKFPEHEDVPGWEVITEADWDACASEVVNGWLSDPVTLALEVNPDRTWAAIGAAGLGLRGGTAVEVVEHREGTDWVVDRMIELNRHTPKAVLIDPRSPAGSFGRGLEAAGLVITDVSSVEYAKACGSLVDATKTQTIEHHHQEPLDAAVAWACKRHLGDAFLFDRRGATDVTPLAAVTLARWGHLEFKPAPRTSVYEGRGMEVVG